MSKFYLAGPMRGIDAYNFPAFFEAEAILVSLGHTVFNPALNDCIEYGLDINDPRAAGQWLLDNDVQFSIRRAMSVDLRFITEEADAVVVLPGSETSSGVAAEIATARAIGIPVHNYSAVGGFCELRLVPPTAKPLGGGSGEVRTTSSTGGQKGVKPERYDLIPKFALDGLGRVYAFGAEKYADHNWRKRYEWSKSYAAMLRHLSAFWDGETLDPESGLPHIDHAGFHWAALSTWLAEDGEGSEFDDRYVREGKRA